jgi:hypothetical protein
LLADETARLVAVHDGYADVQERHIRSELGVRLPQQVDDQFQPQEHDQQDSEYQGAEPELQRRWTRGMAMVPNGTLDLPP